jgi:hypothetical protein
MYSHAAIRKASVLPSKWASSNFRMDSLVVMNLTGSVLLIVVLCASKCGFAPARFNTKEHVNTALGGAPQWLLGKDHFGHIRQARSYRYRYWFGKGARV